MLAIDCGSKKSLALTNRSVLILNERRWSGKKCGRGLTKINTAQSAAAAVAHCMKMCEHTLDWFIIFFCSNKLKRDSIYLTLYGKCRLHWTNKSKAKQSINILQWTKLSFKNYCRKQQHQQHNVLWRWCSTPMRSNKNSLGPHTYSSYERYSIMCTRECIVDGIQLLIHTYAHTHIFLYMYNTYSITTLPALTRCSAIPFLCPFTAHSFSLFLLSSMHCFRRAVLVPPLSLHSYHLVDPMLSLSLCVELFALLLT